MVPQNGPVVVPTDTFSWHSGIHFVGGSTVVSTISFFQAATCSLCALPGTILGEWLAGAVVGRIYFTLG